MNLNDLLSWLSDDYRQKLDAKKQAKEARRQMLLRHYSNNYEGPRDDSTGVPLHHQWEEKWPRLFQELKKEPKPPPRIEDDWLLGNHPLQRQRKYY